MVTLTVEPAVKVESIAPRRPRAAAYPVLCAPGSGRAARCRHRRVLHRGAEPQSILVGRRCAGRPQPLISISHLIWKPLSSCEFKCGMLKIDRTYMNDVRCAQEIDSADRFSGHTAQCETNPSRESCSITASTIQKANNGRSDTRIPSGDTLGELVLHLRLVEIGLVAQVCLGLRDATMCHVQLPAMACQMMRWWRATARETRTAWQTFMLMRGNAARSASAQLDANLMADLEYTMKEQNKEENLPLSDEEVSLRTADPLDRIFQTRDAFLSFSRTTSLAQP